MIARCLHEHANMFCFCACVCMDVSKRFCVAGRTVFFCARLRASPVRKGVIGVFPFRAVFHYLFYLWHEGSNTKCF